MLFLQIPFSAIVYIGFILCVLPQNAVIECDHFQIALLTIRIQYQKNNLRNIHSNMTFNLLKPTGNYTYHKVLH